MESLVENIDQIAQHDFDNHKVFGCNYFVYHKGHSVERCYGTISLNSDNPVTNTTVFRLASMSKPITAVATLIFMEKGLSHSCHTVLESFKIKGCTKRTCFEYISTDKILLIRLLNNKE